jgi:hypothetical protein
MNFSKIAGDISEIAGDPATSEQSVKKIIINTSLSAQYSSIGPILANVSIVLPFAFWHAWQAHPSLG